MKVVLKFGGSIFMPESGADTEFIRELCMFLATHRENHEFAIVVGAGKYSREFAKICRNFTADEDRIDMVGIMVARLNAAILSSALGEIACPEIPRSEAEFLELAKKYPGKIIICGGFRPRQRTDAVAVEIAKVWGGKMVIKGTNVDYAYDKDPNKCEDAKPLKKITFSELRKIGDQEHAQACAPTIMDSKATELLVQEKIKVAIVNGRNLENIAKILAGEKFTGTRVGF